MSLRYEAETVSAFQLVERVASLVHTRLDRRNGPTKKLTQAVAAVIADLLSIANEPGERYLYRPRGLADFTEQRIGYRPCISALDGMFALDLLHWTPGLWLGTQRLGEGDTARYRPKLGLLEMAFRFGITPGNWRSHFRVAARSPTLAHPVIVRAKRQFWDKEEKGRKLPVDKRSPAYRATADQVNRINTYMAPQLITGCNHDGFVRIYNHGDQRGFDYNMGGRLYSRASGVSYQNMEKKYRHNMRLNGEPVVELDISASFLTIFYALMGQYVKAEPYIIEDLPRDVSKAWINTTLGYDRFHAKWPSETARKLLDKKGIDLLADYDIRAVRSAVLEAHPILQGWLDSPYRWQDFQYLESSAIIDAVEMLARDHDLPALALHDALLIPASTIDVAGEVLAATFRSWVGLNPVLTIKDGWGGR